MARAARFERMLRLLAEDNAFYRAKLAGAVASRLPHLDDLARLPFTTKEELLGDQELHPPFGSNLTFPLERYVRGHQTSGSTGRPLRWLDTAESWDWWLECWLEIFRAAGVTAEDRVYVPAPGPSIGFATGFDASQRLGALTLSGSGLSTLQRLEAMRDYSATVLACTPTYALRLLEAGREQGIDLRDSAVRVTIHAGEPGASIPSVKGLLEDGWGARCVDHAGATEVGAWGFGCGVELRMHVNEAEFVAEVIDPESGEPVEEGERGELVLTNLGRLGSPVLRYRTGDMVTLHRDPCPCGRTGAYLAGGVLGRSDDMVVVRGVNVFPSSIENIVREQPEIGEFEMRVRRERAMGELVVRVEIGTGEPEAVAARLEQRLRSRLGLRPTVEIVPPGFLPRHEGKSKRLVVETS